MKDLSVSLVIPYRQDQLWKAPSSARSFSIPVPRAAGTVPVLDLGTVPRPYRSRLFVAKLALQSSCGALHSLADSSDVQVRPHLTRGDPPSVVQGVLLGVGLRAGVTGGVGTGRSRS